MDSKIMMIIALASTTHNIIALSIIRNDDYTIRLKNDDGKKKKK